MELSDQGEDQVDDAEMAAILAAAKDATKTVGAKQNLEEQYDAGKTVYACAHPATYGGINTVRRCPSSRRSHA